MTTTMYGTARYRPVAGRTYVHPGDTNPPELPWLAPDTDYFVPVGGTLWDCPNTATLLTAIANAADGDRIQVHPGVRYSLSYVQLPQHNNWVYVFVASKLSGTFPLASSIYHIGGTQTRGARVGPEHSFAALGASSPLAQFELPDDGSHSNANPILYAQLGGGGFWWFEGIEFMLNETLTTGPISNPLLMLGTTLDSVGWFPASAKDIPSHFHFGHCLFHGTRLTATTFSNGPRRAINANVSHLGIRDCSAYFIQVDGAEAAAVGGWNTPGVFSSINNFMSGTAQAILFGGSPPYVPGVVMKNFTTKWNWLWKDARWFKSSGQSASYGCKNHYEHKNGCVALVEDTVMEHNSGDGQDGGNILFQNLLDSTPAVPANKINDITLRNIKVYGGGPLGAWNGAVSGGPPSVTDFTEQPMSRVLLTNILGEQICGVLPESLNPVTGCARYGLQVADSVRDFCMEHVTVEAADMCVRFLPLSSAFDLNAATRFTARNNIMGYVQIGSNFSGQFLNINSSGSTDAIENQALINATQGQGYAVNRNVGYCHGGTPNSSTLAPANNTLLPDVAGVGFDTNYATAAPSALASTSAYKGYGTDGQDPGADVAGIAAMVTAVKGSTTLPP